MSDHLSVSIPSRKTIGNRTMITSAFGTDWTTLTLDDLLEIEVETRRYPTSDQTIEQIGIEQTGNDRQPVLNNIADGDNDENNSAQISNNNNAHAQRIRKKTKEMDMVTSELHRSILAADPSINAIFHVHTPAMLEFSCLKPEQQEPYGRFLMLHPNSCQFYNKIMYFDESADLKGQTGMLIINGFNMF